MSKLSKIEKTDLQNMRLHFAATGGKIVRNDISGATIAYCRPFSGAKCLQISISKMADDEPKFRKSVGDYEALCNMVEKGEFIQIPVDKNNEEYFMEQFLELFDCA